MKQNTNLAFILKCVCSAGNKRKICNIVSMLKTSEKNTQVKRKPLDIRLLKINHLQKFMITLRLQALDNFMNYLLSLRKVLPAKSL